MGEAAKTASNSGAQRAARLGRYEVIGLLARGGMAELLLARRAGAGGFAKVVVLKRILPQFAHDPDFNRMFLDEARLAGTLDHPNVVRIFDVDEADGSFFFAMEYIHGEDLRKFLKAAVQRQEQIPYEAVISTVIDVCKGLHHAHEGKDFEGNPLNIVHRDISPANILVTYEGHVKVVDFGIARATRTNTYTQAGQRKGKVAYMSPEQCRGEIVDRRSDIFALGILLWEMSTLHRLFRTDDEFATMNLIVNQEITRPSDKIPDYPLDLETIVMKALAKDRDRRYASAKELQADLERYAKEAGLDTSAARRAQVMKELLGYRPVPWEDESQLQPVSLGTPTGGHAAVYGEQSASGLMEVGGPAQPTKIEGVIGEPEPKPRGRAALPIVIALVAAAAGGGAVWAMLPRNGGDTGADTAVAGPSEDGAKDETPTEPEPPTAPVEPVTDTSTTGEPEPTGENGSGETGADDTSTPEAEAEPEPEPEPAPKKKTTKKKPTKKKAKKKAGGDAKERDPDAFMPG